MKLSDLEVNYLYLLSHGAIFSASALEYKQDEVCIELWACMLAVALGVRRWSGAESYQSTAKKLKYPKMHACHLEDVYTKIKTHACGLEYDECGAAEFA